MPSPQSTIIHIEGNKSLVRVGVPKICPRDERHISWMECYVRKVNTVLNNIISWNRYLRRIIIHFIVLFLRQNAAELLLKIQIGHCRVKWRYMLSKAFQVPRQKMRLVRFITFITAIIVAASEAQLLKLQIGLGVRLFLIKCCQQWSSNQALKMMSV